MVLVPMKRRSVILSRRWMSLVCLFPLLCVASVLTTHYAEEVGDRDTADNGFTLCLPLSHSPVSLTHLRTPYTALILVLHGPPRAGSTTVAVRVAQDRSLPVLSVNDILATEGPPIVAELIRARDEVPHCSFPFMV